MIVYLLAEGDALVADVHHGRAHRNVVEFLYLRYEIGFVVHHHHCALAPVDLRAYLLEIIYLARIEEFKIGRVVDMAEAVPVFPAYLDGQTVMELYFFHIGM